MNIFESPSHFLDWSIDHKKLLGDNEKHFNDYYYNYIKKDGFEKNMKKYFDYNSLQVRNHITKMFKKKQDLNILEIGSGCGTESIFFALMGAKVKGIDVRKKRLECAKKRACVLEEKFSLKLNIDFEYKTIMDYEEHNQFDIIWMEQAFHHIEPRENLFDKLSKLLSKDGCIFLSEANPLHPGLSLSLFRKRGFKTIKTIKDNDGNDILYGDERIITHFSLRKEFKKRGYNYLGVQYYRVVPNNNFLMNNFYFLEKVVPRWLVFFFAQYNIGFSLKK